jgi:hypothetical protein
MRSQHDTPRKPVAPSVAKAPRARRKNQPHIEHGSREARLRAAIILDVLAGVRTPSEAAQSLSVSLPRYYALETRLLEQLVAACENRPRGKQVGPEKRIADLEHEVQRLRRDCARKSALVRAVQRTMGVPLPDKRLPEKGRRKRRPVVRALKAAAVLRTVPEDNGPGTGAGSLPNA